MGGQSATAKGAGKLERHKSVAVMESIGPKSPSTTPNKRIQKLAATTPKCKLNVVGAGHRLN